MNLDRLLEIENAAGEWEKSNKSPAYLLSDKRLRSAKAFQKEQQANYPLSILANSFVASSKKQQRNRQIKFLGVFLVVPLIGTAITAPFIIQEIGLNDDKKLIQDCVGKKYCPGRIQALEILVKAKKNISKYNLSSADLGGANLSGVNLSGVNLSEANLSGANLSEVSLSRAELFGANLSRADLSGAILSRAELSGANLSSADLSGANLHGINLRGAYLYRASLDGAKLTNASLDDANLSGASLNNANLSRVRLDDASLYDADLSGANLSDANLIGARLNNADLSGANLSDAELFGASISDANLNRADLSRANLMYVYPKNADLSGANLIDASLAKFKMENLNNSFLSFPPHTPFQPSQIKSTCNWEQAIYKLKYFFKKMENGEFNRPLAPYALDEQSLKELRDSFIDKTANKQYIEELKQDKASDPKEKTDCSVWE